MDKAMKQYEVLNWASLFLEQHHREPKVAEMLLQHHLNVSRTSFFVSMQDVVPENIVEKFQRGVREHARTGVPVQHLIGYEMFYGRKFNVNQNVLIPRPETEELVEKVIAIVHENFRDQPVSIVDVGTGSGIIASTLALELSDATVYATDISADALAVAKENALGLGAEVTFFNGSFLQPLIDENIKVDIIVSNPPYIAWSELPNLSDTVKSFDPELALFADDDGLAAYKQIITEIPQVMKSQSYAAFEIGYQQGEAVQSLLVDNFPKANCQVIQDINGKDRIITAKIGGVK